MNDEYGKSPFNPIKVIGVEASLSLLNSMLTDKNKPFLYHRIHTTTVGNSKPIDCYEIYKGDCVNEVLFFYAYSNMNDTEMPKGYKINSGNVEPLQLEDCEIISTVGVNYKLKRFPDDIIKII